MTSRARPVLIDDRLLVEELTIGLERRPRRPLMTSSYWYLRAARAASLGAGGQLSGPFLGLPPLLQRRAIASLLQLRDDIALPDPRRLVPAMVEVAADHPQLNLLNLEAASTAHLYAAEVWLSPKGAAGLLPGVLDALRVRWQVVALGG
ncbi:MAG TPA: hypothetical protein P5254_04260 [Aquihabitans sp.]|nr:hypothetical protein [Aquihabitans sp.]